MPTTSAHSVVIVGGGPTGLTLAGELALAGVDVVIVERRTTQDVDGSRAGGLHARSIEIYDQRGIADRFLSEGQTHPFVGFALLPPLDISDFPTRHNYLLALGQGHIERILADWVESLGVPILRGCEATGFTQDPDGVHVEMSDGRTLRTQYLVGCDGGRSLIRKTAGIDFPGLDASRGWIIAEVEMTGTPTVGILPEGGGLGPVNPAEPDGRYRAVLPGMPVDEDSVPTLQDVSAALIRIYGSDFGVHSPTWISRFSDATRQAATYRQGRVFVAGDAAHVHPPQGGQGLNTGVQDAVNLGWKLAQVVAGRSPESLLDTYHHERHPVAARVLHNTMAQSALGNPGDRHQALRDIVADLLAFDEPRRRIVGMMSGLDIHYDLGEGHPLLGRRIPDLDIVTVDGPTTIYHLLHPARPVLLTSGSPGTFDIAPWSPHISLVEAEFHGAWDLPVIGPVDAPAAVLIRPDGHVAWTGDLSDPALPEALNFWFGGGLNG